MRTCLKCRNKKEVIEFTKRVRLCDVCIDAYLAKGTPEHKEATRKLWIKNNPEKIASISKKCYIKRIEKEPDYHKKLYKRQLEINPNTFRNPRRSANFRNRTKNDLWYRVRQTLSARLYCAIQDQGGIKAHKTMILVGCDAKTLIAHIENQFTPEMNWQNRGTYFEVDHIIPCRFFNLTNELCQRVCFHWSNLRPMEKYANKSKSNKMLHPEHLQVILNHLNISIDEFEAANSTERREAEAV